MYNEFMLLTSGAALRLVTPVEAVSEVVIPTEKTTWGAGAALYILRGGTGYSTHPHLLGWEKKKLPQMPPPSPWSGLADSKKCLGTAQKIRSIDWIGLLSSREHLVSPVHQIQAGLVCFQTQVHSTNSLHPLWRIEPRCTIRCIGRIYIYIYVYTSMAG